METLINYEVVVINTPLNCEGYEDDVSLGVRDPAGANTGLKEREATFNNSKVSRLIGRLHSELWHQEKLIPLQSSSMCNCFPLARHRSS